MARILFYFLLWYVGIVVAVYFGQRYLQYFPDRQAPGKPADSGVAEMKEIRVRTEDGLELWAWFVPPKKKDGKIIVMYHGNAGNAANRGIKARPFIDAGYGFYLCEYRGFGGNAGRINEAGLYSDARAALRWLDKNGYLPSQWVLYGESIGSGPAVQMAVEFQPRQLILEAPFTSAADVAKGRYFWLPVDFLLKDRYDNLSKIKSVKSSVLIIHGDEDPVVPYVLGKTLYEAANHPKELITIEGGHHNDLYEHHAGHILTGWLEKQAD